MDSEYFRTNKYLPGDVEQEFQRAQSEFIKRVRLNGFNS